jgi:AcrR family transcriptional regulator
MAYRKTEFVENKRRQTRERILHAAKKLVENGGWENCNLTKVAKNSGVASGSIYNYFEKITDLYIEVFYAIADEEIAVISNIANSKESPLERFKLAISTFASRALKGRTKAYAVIGEPVAQEVDSIRQKYHAKFIEQYERIISDGVKAGDFHAQTPRTSATCAFGALVETLVVPLASTASNLPDNGLELQNEILSFCLRAVQPINSSVERINANIRRQS